MLAQFTKNSDSGEWCATAIDLTLPFIKQNCRSSDMQLAIFSRYILTLMTPFLMVLFASL
ncbi:LysO family transporter [Acinetobacter sp. ANC 4641]|uniref:LysO family transporter n=1 Tax=Acinetobacter sp. ANC 4641 TaxID=2529847 RepID=UPI0013F15752